MKNPNWADDLIKYSSTVRHGDITVTLHNHQSHTDKLFTSSEETLLYEDNDKAMNNALAFLLSLIQDKFTGTTGLNFTFKDGMIKEIGYKSIKETRYQKDARREQRT